MVDHALTVLCSLHIAPCSCNDAYEINCIVIIKRQVKIVDRKL